LSAIRHVYIFDNGMVGVFDRRGEQMGCYQGPWEVRREKMLADAPPEREFFRTVGSGWGAPHPVKREEL
jgi:hypothetical protein